MAMHWMLSRKPIFFAEALAGAFASAELPCLHDVELVFFLILIIRATAGVVSIIFLLLGYERAI